MATKGDRGKKKGKREPGRLSWPIRVFFISVSLSAVLSLVSNQLLGKASLAVSFIILLGFIALGVVFDIIGVAVTTADERPFHSMASHHAPGARESLRLIRRASQVSSFCNDVVGDTLMLFDSSIEPGALHQLSRESLISDPADDGPGKILIVPYTIRFLGPRLQGGKRRQ